MKRVGEILWLAVLYLAAVWLALNAGCAARVAPATFRDRPAVVASRGAGRGASPATVIVWNKELAGGERAWQALAERRFGKPVVVLVCHGGGDPWTLHPDPPRPEMPTAAAAWLLHDAFPGREILLICCNESAVRLDVPGVAYALRRVWSLPGCGDPSDTRTIEEFVEGSAPGPTTAPTTQP